MDLVEVGRFAAALQGRPRLRQRLFTAGERAECAGKGDPAASLAVRFAAKEAVGKLLGCGVVSWQQVEIGSGPPPAVRLSGRMAAVACERGVGVIALSLSHGRVVAGATAVAVTGGWRAATAGGEGEELVAHRVEDPFALLPVEQRPAGLSPEQVRALDRAAIEEVGIPGPVLMERAALGVTRLVLARYPGRHTLIVCGRGNNGGDGLAAARQLHLAGQPVACVVAAEAADQLSPDAALNLAAAEGAGVNLRLGAVPDYLWDETQLVVDCLLGTGARGGLRPPLDDWAGRINAAGARGIPVIAVDVPSGVDAADGSLAQGTVAADCTVTFHAAKSGLLCPPGSEAAGELLVWDIGLPGFLQPEPDVRVVTAADVAVPGRRADDHKYRAGFVCVVAGSAAYPGAALLSALAAARSGAGYVRLVAPGGAMPALRGHAVEVVLHEVEPGDALTDADAVLAAAGDDRLGALVIGPGLGRGEETAAVVRRLVEREGRPPAVLDADGLLAYAGRPGALRGLPPLVLTPHAGELAALLDASPAEIVRAALPAARRAAQETGQTTLLKGSSTVIVGAEGEAWVVVQAPPQLATAGTGDVLAGIVGALLAKGMPPLEAAKAACWLHAEAGRAGARDRREGLLATDLLPLLPPLLSAHANERRPSWTS